jgi:membrane protease YdiL (CAAX protease family)
MNDKEVQDLDKKPDPTTLKDVTELHDEMWSFCPVCGNKIPKVQKLKFCMTCGTNLSYLKEHNRLEQEEVLNPYIQPSKHTRPYTPTIFFGPKKISDDDLNDIKNQKLWGTSASIGVPIGAFLLMNFLTVGILILIIFASFDPEFLDDLLLNPYFLIFSSFFELIFILVPILYVAKFLQNPSLENRFRLLGFTTRGFERKGVLKEILLGLGFAIIGLLLVGITSFLTEIILESIFGINIVSDFSSSSSDVGLIIGSADIFSLILLSIVMILIIGTSEEILFRGFMQKGLVRSLGNKWGIVLTALIFALIHVIAIFLVGSVDPLVLVVSFFLSFIPYFAISLLLGFLYFWRNENLLAVIITHGVYDALTIIMAFLFYNLF